ncbi:nuclear hormone receptor e75 [Plakobranchus ocellatus]|uniref:Nuclear hormone receptor e75 n=1 Tax=Plakobranchus ocellatus TaxID=259542 RepID=A0AAV3XWJ2_9GAST|nr:nuclear hormone receptor e75 [Plakobranchus ocellatus]
MGRKKDKEMNPINKKKKVLPPCKVCDAPAAGFHYGVNTCEACKGFFHRSLRFYKQYICEKNDACNIQHGRKKMCQKCRYDKCISVGMAKGAIKTGRYTTTKHTEDTLELQRLQQKEKLQTKLSREGIFMKALADSSGQDFRDKLRQRLENDESSGDSLFQSSKSAVCCNEDTLSFRCLNNLACCQTYQLLRRKCGLESPLFIFAITSVSIQSEPLSVDCCVDTDFGKKERKRILQMCVKQALYHQEGCTSPLPSQPVFQIPKDLETCCSPSICDRHCRSKSHSQASFNSPISPSSSNPSPESVHSAHLLSPQQLSHTVMSPCSSLADITCSSFCHSCGLALDNRSIEELYADKDLVSSLLVETYDKHVKPHVVRISKEQMDLWGAEHLEVCKLNQEMFGPRHRVPDSEFDYIYTNTGIDSDNRLDRFESYIQIVEHLVPLVVKFSKSIPGFSHLPLVAKVNLIKYAITDFFFLDIYTNVSTKHSVTYCMDGTFRCTNDCRMDYHGDIQHIVKLVHLQHIKVCNSFQKLELTLEEECLVRAILIVTPDRELWSPGDLAKSIYEHLHVCLIHLLRKRPGNTMTFYTKIVDCLIDLRSYMFNLISIVKRMGMQKYTRLLQDPLLRGMMAGILFEEDDDYEGEAYEELKRQKNVSGNSAS